MIVEQTTVRALPKTLAEFMAWEPTDAYKYEWNDGELIRFVGVKKDGILSHRFVRPLVGYDKIF
jgi:hypothetical protein